jgi:hypothetical protein
MVCLARSRDSIVGLATGYGLEDRGVGDGVPVGSRIFSSPRRPKPALGSTQPPTQCAPGALSPGVKRQGREADHSPPASVEVKKIWIYTSTPTYTSVKHRDNFTFKFMVCLAPFSGTTVRTSGL